MYTKTYNKSLLRMFWTNKIRFIIIATLTAISTAIVGGFGSIAPRVRRTVNYALSNAPNANYPYECPESAFCPEEGYFDGALHTALGIERISYVFPLFFVIVTCLVVFMTITRLVETEKTQIACLKTMGYNKTQIVGKYILFTLIASLVGVGLGVITSLVISGVSVAVSALVSAYTIYCACVIISLICAVSVAVTGSFAVGFVLIMLTVIYARHNTHKTQPNSLMFLFKISLLIIRFLYPQSLLISDILVAVQLHYLSI